MHTKKAIFHFKTGGYSPNQDALHQLPRHQQTIIFRPRTGHYRLNNHLKRISVKTSAQCPCGEADQTPEHNLQSYSLHQQARQQIWPTCVPQNQALGVCRGFVPDIQVFCTHGREDLVNATITSNAEEEEGQGRETQGRSATTCQKQSDFKVDTNQQAEIHWVSISGQLCHQHPYLYCPLPPPPPPPSPPSWQRSLRKI